MLPITVIRAPSNIERIVLRTAFDLEVHDMNCPSCVPHVESAIKSVSGVTRVQVVYSTGRVRVESISATSLDAVVDALEQAGYTTNLLEDTGTPAEAGMKYGQNDALSSLYDFDLLVIGTGGAGVAAAIRGAELGARVGIVEAGTLGGTCVNVGCIPSKNLIAAAQRFHTARTGFPGISKTNPHLNWQEVIRQKRVLVGELRTAKYSDVLASYPEITLLNGIARLEGNRRVSVGATSYLARKVILAAGASPWMPPIPGLETVEPLNSTTVMDLDELPRSMIVLGAGYVALELGQLLSRFGVQITLLNRGPLIARGEDAEVSTELRRRLEEEGMEIHTGIRYVRVEKVADEVIVHVEQNGEPRTFRAGQILVATGRRANTQGLGLEESGVTMDANGFVQVHDTLQTTEDGVYAAGDVTGGLAFVYTAARDGRIAAENAVTGSTRRVDNRVVPRVTFTDPQIAAVGVTEAEARAAGLDIDVRRLDLTNVPRAVVEHDARGFIKLVAERGSGRLLGVHAIAPHAGELMGEAALAVRLGLSVADLAETLHPYLTWGEGLKLAAQTFKKDVARLSCCA